MWLHPYLMELVYIDIALHRLLDLQCEGVIGAELVFGEIREQTANGSTASSADISVD